MINKFEEIAKKESQTIKDLTERMEAYKLSVNSDCDYRIKNSCFEALKAETLYIAKKGNAEQYFIDLVEFSGPTTLDWANILYVLIDNVPSLRKYFEKVMASINQQ